ncbi:MAG TPA: YihY/virulence factor BrkB family protein [Halococcus sp.]|nr:YihY/virulence factor BrkB family protein [Halococcus sp.]
MSNASGPIGVIAGVVSLARRERIVLTAASLAYFSFISVVPLLILLVVAVSEFGGHALAMGVVSRATHALAAEHADLLGKIVFSAANRQQATVIGVVVLLWGALLTFRALSTAFASVYDTHGERSLVSTVMDVVLVFVVIVSVTVAIVVLGVALSLFVDIHLWKTLGPFVLCSVLVAVFFPLFYILPDVDIRVTEALPGTVFAAAAWTVLQSLFGYYVALSGVTRFYGAASAFLLILVWLYVGGFVLLLGAALNAVLSGRVEPDTGWLPVDT